MTDELSDGVDTAALAGYTLYDEMIERLAVRFPHVPLNVIESIAHHEYEAITGGALLVVPTILEDGTAEQLERRATRLGDAR